MFRTLPAMTPGYLHPSNHTIPPRLSPCELTHRKVLNGIQEHASTGPKQQGTYLTSSTNSLSLQLFTYSDGLTYSNKFCVICEYNVNQCIFPSSFAVRMWTYFLFSALSEQTGDETDSVDGDSVKGLGETTDFLNMVRNLKLSWNHIWQVELSRVCFSSS